jgi:hypothetical protein
MSSEPDAVRPGNNSRAPVGPLACSPPAGRWRQIRTAWNRPHRQGGDRPVRWVVERFWRRGLAGPRRHRAPARGTG